MAQPASDGDRGGGFRRDAASPVTVASASFASQRVHSRQQQPLLTTSGERYELARLSKSGDDTMTLFSVQSERVRADF